MEKERDPEVRSLSDREDGVIKIRSEERFKRKSTDLCFGQIRNDLKANQPGLCVREAVRYARLDGTELRV